MTTLVCPECGASEIRRRLNACTCLNCGWIGEDIELVDERNWPAWAQDPPTHDQEDPGPQEEPA